MCRFLCGLDCLLPALAIHQRILNTCSLKRWLCHCCVGNSTVMQERETDSLDKGETEEMREENALGYKIWKENQQNLGKQGKWKGKTTRMDFWPVKLRDSIVIYFDMEAKKRVQGKMCN